METGREEELLVWLDTFPCYRLTCICYGLGIMVGKCVGVGRNFTSVRCAQCWCLASGKSV